MIFVSKSPKETQVFAAQIAGKVMKMTSKKAIVLALEGELGAGKTTFIQGFAKALKVKTKVKSPTFNLMKAHKITYSSRLRRGFGGQAKLKSPAYAKASAGGQNFRNLYHIDCYRLKDHKDLIPLDIDEILKASDNIVLIEWSDRVKEILPKGHITIHFDHISETTRKITITSK